LTTLLAILGIIVILSSLVIAHEWGHFITARRNGVLVREFGIGFPPRLFGFRRQGSKTTYSINALPIGGFVSLKGEDGKESGGDSLANQSTWVKTKVLLAGVTINLLIAYLILTGLLLAGVANVFPFTLPFSSWQTAQSHQASTVQVVDVESGSAASQIGLALGDTIKAIDGQTITGSNQLRDITKSDAGKSITINYRHANQDFSRQVTLGSSSARGYLGVATAQTTRIQYRWWAAPIAAMLISAQLAWATVAAFGGLIALLVTKARVPNTVAGPIGITAALPQVSAFGFANILLLIAQISLSLAVVNSLPIGPLDGSKVFVIWLRASGVKLSKRFEYGLQSAGLILLVIIIIAVTINDIVHLHS